MRIMRAEGANGADDDGGCAVADRTVLDAVASDNKENEDVTAFNSYGCCF